ncbi:hypothetical protein HDU98_000072 [Podochytrium sp. JEL0797]|nr:hypothetical protein HDU98_000072 [Podochytrium sp. JEL0797]
MTEIGSKTGVLFLAAGYGTRLQRDISADTSGRFDALKGVTKALLPLAKVPLIEHWLKVLDKETTSAFIVCNASTHPQFLAWAQTTHFPTSRIFNDGTTTNETRRGACTDISDAIKHFHLEAYKQVLVIAGDTLFLRDFSLSAFLHLAESLPTTSNQTPCLVASYTVSQEMDTLKTGIIETNPSDYFCAAQRVTSLIEKPHPSETVSRLACPCFYAFSRDAIPYVHQFVESSIAAGEVLEKRDASGRLIEWLVRVFPVYEVGVGGRLDIGGLESYVEVEEYMSGGKM